jgi:hypothetical protein
MAVGDGIERSGKERDALAGLRRGGGHARGLARALSHRKADRRLAQSLASQQIHLRRPEKTLEA